MLVLFCFFTYFQVFGVQQNTDSSLLSDLKGEGKGKEAGETGKEVESWT